MFITKRRMREVLPTAASPTKHTFVLMRCISGMEGASRFSQDYLKRPARKSSGRNLFPRGFLGGCNAPRTPDHPRLGRDGSLAGAFDRQGRQIGRGRDQGG